MSLLNLDWIVENFDKESFTFFEIGLAGMGQSMSFELKKRIPKKVTDYFYYYKSGYIFYFFSLSGFAMVLSNSCKILLYSSSQLVVSTKP